MRKAPQPVEPEVVEEIDDVDARVEAVTTMPTAFYGHRCPFRGQPYVPPLDDRCPPTLPAFGSSALEHVRGGESHRMVVPIPVMREDSYCRSCLHDQVREAEDGRNPSVRRPSIAGKRRVRR